MRILLCLVCLAAFFGWGSAAAVAGAAVIYPLPEVKLFQLQERTVAAVAIEHRLPGKDLEDVLGFISSAGDSDLNAIADEMMENGYEYECLECETHECEEHECNHDEEMAEVKNEFIHHLVERNNQFGLDDMLDELKREGQRIGAYLKVEEKL